MNMLLKNLIRVFFLSCSILSNASILPSEEDSKAKNLYYFNDTLSSVPLSYQHLYEPADKNAFNPNESFRIDLHGNSLETAKERVINFIKQAQELGLSHIHFICGRGKHKNSQGKRGVIFKAFPEWLKNQEITNSIDSYRKGIGTYEVFLKNAKGQDEKGYTLKTSVLLQLADIKDNAQAQFILGNKYQEGSGVRKNLKKAVTYYTKAAEQGHSLAQLQLGYMHAMGLGIIHDSQKAFSWYQKAAHCDEPKAWLNMATMHYVGEGKKQDFRQSLSCYLKAAKLGEVMAQRMLGIMYRAGLGTEPNDYRAIKWDRRAAENGDAPAKVNLGYMLLSGRGTSSNPTEALKYFQEASEENIAEAWLHLGKMNEKGIGTEKNEKEALRCYTKAAFLNTTWASFKAQYLLGHMYDKGYMLPQDAEKSAHWYLKAATNGHSEAQWRIGFFYRVGRGVEGNLRQSFKWLRKSAHNGAGMGMWHLAEVYMLGMGVPKNEKQAFKWAVEAARQGNEMALLYFGLDENLLQKLGISITESLKTKLNDLKKFVSGNPKETSEHKNEELDLIAWENVKEADLDQTDAQQLSLKKQEADICLQSISEEPEDNPPVESQIFHEHASLGLPSNSDKRFESPLEEESFDEQEFSLVNSNTTAVLSKIEKGWFHRLFGLPFSALELSHKVPMGLI
ncbi:MAG: SEL1-like repeat protein [Alphaproteobacteria bacterium]|nr:SEL1-like repeat protein [Alphaproteobacteria bacterium]